MRTKFFPLAAAILFLAGCAGMEADGSGGSAFGPYPPPGMEHRVGTSHIEVFWRCLWADAGRLALEGMTVNRYSAQSVNYFEAELVGVDAAGRVRSAGRGRAQDIVIRTYEGSPFRIVLTATGDEARFDLYYQYDYYERLQGRLASAGATPAMVAAKQHYLARDACNPAQHRMR